MTVKELLEKHGMTTAELSRRFKIPYRTAQDWKLGNRNPAPWVLLLLEAALENDKKQ